MLRARTLRPSRRLRSLAPLMLAGLAAACGSSSGGDGACPAPPTVDLAEPTFPVTPVKLVTGKFRSAEGLAFSGEGKLYAVADKGVWRVEPTGDVVKLADLTNPVGLAAVGPGDLLVAEQGRASFSESGANNDGALVRMTPDGATTTVATGGMGDPNFILVRAAGDYLVSDDFTKDIWRVEANGNVESFSTAVASPNGMVEAPDGSALYVAQTFSSVTPSLALDKRVARLSLTNGAPGGASTFATLGDERPGSGSAPDGMAIDHKGRIYVAANIGGEIWRLDPATGEQVVVASGMVGVASLAFGQGAFDGGTLYATGLIDGTLWAVPLGVSGGGVCRVIEASELATCLRVLRALVADRAELAGLDADARRELLEAAGRLARPERGDKRKLQKALRRLDREAVRAHDARLVRETLNRTTRRASDFVLPASTAVDDAPAPDTTAELLEPRSCYVCKAEFRRVHPFYDSMCPPCAALNWEKRHQSAPLAGRVAVVTGARIKIGYQTALKLLRAGCTVLATTRFPRDAALRFAREPDHAAWAERLQVWGLDLRFIPAVERFARHLAETLPRLDVLVNNAAQTVWRPEPFYEHLRADEARPLAELPGAVRSLLRAADEAALPAPEPASLARLVRDEVAFPAGRFDLDGQQLDLRVTNSWRQTLAEVPTIELVEVHLVNAMAPFVLTARLRPLLERDRTDEKHVIHVSAMEAQFARNKKTDKHPHTNMAKAALNMMTRTSAVDYVRAGIHMNSVDTGWVTDEDPLHHVARKQDVHDFHPPLDAIDGAARVLDPLFHGLRTGQHAWGHFFKDYAPTAW